MRKFSKRDRARPIEEVPKYMDPENIADEFKDRKSRRAISAVFRWLSLNSIVVRALKNDRFEYVSLHNMDKGDAIVLHYKVYYQAKKVLNVDDGE